MAGKDTVRKGVFVSYSHADRRWLERLQVHMRPLVRDAEVGWWDDTMINAGADWRSEIEHALASAKVAVLLVSAEFLASDFIANDELPKLLEAAEDEGAIIIPLILSPSRFSRIPSLARFQAVNPPDRPLAMLKRWQQEELLDKAAHAIEDALAAGPQTSQEPRRAAAQPAGEFPPPSKPTERTKEPSPRLEVFPTELDFGSLNVGTECPPRTLVIKQSAAGTPPRASASARWIRVKRVKDIVTVTIVTVKPGNLEGEVVIRGDAGECVVPVRALIEQGPVLHVQPAAIDFGQVTAGEAPRDAVAISNNGSGNLTWKYGTAGDFFRVRRTRDRLTLTLIGGVGDHLGSLWIRSNGGEATVEIRAKVVAAKPPRRATSVVKPRSPTKTHATAPKKKQVRPSQTRRRTSASSSAASDRASTLIAARYRIERKLGGGGRADVYLAQDQELGRRVAIKIFRWSTESVRELTEPAGVSHHPNVFERIRRRATHAAGLSHPNIVSIYDRGETKGSYFIVMEYVEGRTLNELIRSRGPSPIPVAIAYTRQILAALRYAHRHGVIHGDIKSDNVIVDPEGVVKVTDFGTPRASASEMTEEGATIETAQYLSPEHARGAPVDQTSDLYSTGIILYELLTGNVPFTGETPVEIAMKHLAEIPEPPSVFRSDVSEELDAAILRALAKEQADRFQTASEMDLALAEV